MRDGTGCWLLGLAHRAERWGKICRRCSAEQVFQGAALEDSFIFADELILHLAKHFLVVGAALAHLFRISFQNDANFVVNAVLERQFLEHGCVHSFLNGRHVLGLDELSSNQFFGNFAGQIAHIFFRKKHVRLEVLCLMSLTQANRSLAVGRLSLDKAPPRTVAVHSKRSTTDDKPPTTASQGWAKCATDVSS